MKRRRDGISVWTELQQEQEISDLLFKIKLNVAKILETASLVTTFYLSFSFQSYFYPVKFFNNKLHSSSFSIYLPLLFFLCQHLYFFLRLFSTTFHLSSGILFKYRTNRSLQSMFLFGYLEKWISRFSIFHLTSL